MNNRIKGWLFVAGQFLLIGANFVLPSARAAETWQVGVGFALAAAGAVGLAVSALNLGRSLTAHPMPLPDAVLQTTGLYAVVRHPIYTSLIMLLTGATIMSPSTWRWLTVGALVALLFAKARWEEEFLKKKYPGYAEYAARVPMLLPKVTTRKG